MLRVLKLALTALIAGLFVLMLTGWGSERPAVQAGPMPVAPLLTCPNVDGSDDNLVLVGDILAVVGAYYQDYPDPDYAYLYDLVGPYDAMTGMGGQQRVDDILAVVSKYFTVCPLVDTQVAKATQAVLQYRDQNAAIADGYVQVTQNISGHGIHWLKGSLMDGVLDLTQPEGLNYSLDGELLAVYYIDPMWLPGHEQPVEWLFDGPEDMWHDHPGLCQWQGPGGPMVAENVPQADCLALPGGIWFQSFGWMLHLWNLLPNMMGRFMMENPAAG